MYSCINRGRATSMYAKLVIGVVFLSNVQGETFDQSTKIEAKRPWEDHFSFFRSLAGNSSAAAENLDESHLRSLQSSGKCIPQLLDVYYPPTWRAFKECTKAAYNTTNFSIVGAENSAVMDCWCKNNVKKLIQDFSCCEHPSFKQYCEADCNPDCSTKEANDCHSECPAICLERDYAPPSCNCTNGCYKYSRCITARGENHTKEGKVDKICNDRGFYDSPNMVEYDKCVDAQPYRTNWHRRNAQDHCICKAKVKEAFKTHHCCEAKWAAPICNMTCLTEADCKTTDATTCLKACQKTCQQLHPKMITTDCTQKCMTKNSSCFKYRTCKPLEPLAYEYKCNDGTSPATNGCCKGIGYYKNTYHNCPSLCGIKRRYNIYGKLHCQCFNCPADRAKFLKEKVLANMMSAGKKAMNDVCRQVPLPGCPTAELQAMAKKRDAELKKAIDDHPGNPNRALEDKMATMSSKWNAMILLKAHEIMDCIKDSAKCKTNTKTSKNTSVEVKTSGTTVVVNVESKSQGGSGGKVAGSEDDDDDGNGLILGVAIGASAVAILALGGMGYMCYNKGQSRKNSDDGLTLGPLGPIDGDSNVVVGRPVEPDAANGNAIATEGAPVQADSKAAATNEPVKGEGLDTSV
eukprot:TRINITY_DN22974_c0_g1_i1.p1 TRINITY_DN22974_c0_g1~~TRINITY_DN22974_c0_g1_i1.p1  ORF type:complete len:632 (+),score=103.86 TRINITY_DN22974_c0_g1_i1:122-2017(+)